jgi:hypothetical protein
LGWVDSFPAAGVEFGIDPAIEYAIQKTDRTDAEDKQRNASICDFSHYFLCPGSYRLAATFQTGDERWERIDGTGRCVEQAERCFRRVGEKLENLVSHCR